VKGHCWNGLSTIGHGPARQRRPSPHGSFSLRLRQGIPPFPVGGSPTEFRPSPTAMGLVAVPRASRGVGELDLGDGRGRGTPQRWLHDGGGRPVGNGGAGPVAGSRWSENWSRSSGVLGRSCCRGRRGWRTVGEGYRWEELMVDGADGPTASRGLLATYGGSKTGLLLRGDACARGRWC
jgi:hypothetical protein